MKSLQEALQNQLKETSEKAEKQQATVSVLLCLCVLRCGAGKLLLFLKNHYGTNIHVKIKMNTQ